LRDVKYKILDAECKYRVQGFREQGLKRKKEVPQALI